MSEETRNIDSPSSHGRLLGGINTPAELKKLPVEALPQLCSEIREKIIADISRNPGHFASSMGAVELTVALHYVFDTPQDHIVWDVGHQAYAHKILTGRKDSFKDIRTKQGPGGFPNPAESEYDTFTAGHASNSISAALGMAIADANTPGRENRKTVAVIGDASISSGLAFEGLNNASNNPNNLLIVLNDNEMSIDNNVGAMHHYLSKLTTSPRYNKWRQNTYQFLRRKGVIGDSGRGRLLRFNNSVKAFISSQQNIFEGLNIRYFGPFDGHDVIMLVKVLRDIKNMTGPRILHLCTVKGKGYEEAEKDPTTWHAPGKFDPTTGKRLSKSNPEAPLKWQEVFGRTLVELADADERICGITAAMPTGTSMNLMMEKYPKRTFDVGISEGHAVTFAGGLAVGGKRPFVAIYSTFLQRAYDNIINDISIQGLPVTLCIDRAGIVGEDGVTHHGMFDLAYLRAIPGMTVASPMDERTLRNLMYTSTLQDGPMAIRYPRGGATSPQWHTPFEKIEIGKARCLIDREDAHVCVLTIGPVGNDAQKVLNELYTNEGIEANLYDMIWLKPIDKEVLTKIAKRYDHVITIEDGTVTGGLGTAVMEHFAAMHQQNPDLKLPGIRRLGVPDTWVHHGTVAELRADCGYDLEGIRKAVREEASK